MFPGFTAPKVAWVRRHEPRVFERTRWVLLPKDFLRLWLTGEHVSDMSDASGTSWLDTGARRWSAELLAATELDERQMPALVEGTAVSGALRRELAARWGIRGAAVVAGGAGDNAAPAAASARCGRRRVRVARHVGRAVRGESRVLAERRERRAHVLSRGARARGIRWA